MKKLLYAMFLSCMFLVLAFWSQTGLCTVAVETNEVSYNCDDVTTEFPFTFKVFDEDDLKVTVTSAAGDETVLTLTTDYTVSGNLKDGGKITTLVVWATGYLITVELDMDFEQPTDLVYGGTYSSESVETMVDRTVKMVQQLESAIGDVACAGGGGNASISDLAYDATTWNGVTTVGASKNAIRDKFESLGSASSRDAEDNMTDGANLPDGHAIKVYGDAHWLTDQNGTVIWGLINPVSGQNLNIARMPLGGAWTLTSNLNIDSNTTVIDMTNNRVGLGTSTPDEQLDMTGNIQLPNTEHVNEVGVVYKSGERFFHDFNYGDNGNVTTEGENLFLGASAGNLSMGTNATSAYHASHNVGIGSDVLSSNTLGYYNVALGYAALDSNTEGYHNVAIGPQALYLNTLGFYNTAVGSAALAHNTGGDYNTGIGLLALTELLTGNYNTALGSKALHELTTGGYNIGIGESAGKLVTAGGSNAASGSSIYIGHDTRASLNGNTNEICIGHSVYGAGSNAVTLGNDSITKTLLKGDVGVDIASPVEKLDVDGAIHLGTTANSNNGTVRWSGTDFEGYDGSWKSLTSGAGFTDLTEFDTQTAWRAFFSDTDGNTTEQAFGTNGTYWRSNGVNATPSWTTPAGAGDTMAPAAHSADYVPQWNGTSDSKTLVEGFPITTVGKNLVADGNITAQRATLGLGSAALRDAEDTMTDGSNLPDGHAIAVYGDKYWKRNCINVKKCGAIGDGVTDDTAAIQSALDAAAVIGGCVFVPVGTYIIGTTLEISDDTDFSGSGWGSVLKAKSTLSGAILTNKSHDPNWNQYITISDLYFNGNKASRANGYCMYFNNLQWSRITNVKIENSPEHGIYLDGTSAFCDEISFVDCLFRYNENSGIYFHTSSANMMANCSFFSNNMVTGYAAITINGGSTNVINGCSVMSNKAYGIFLSYSYGNVLKGNVLVCNDHHGIYLYTIANDNIISGNVCDCNGQASPGTYSGIVLEGTVLRNTVIGNRCYNGLFATASQNCGVIEAGAADYNVIIGNVLKGNLSSDLVVVGSNTKAFHNVDVADTGTTPGGSTTQVQFNDAGAFGGDSALVWNKSTNVLTIYGNLVMDDTIVMKNNKPVYGKTTGGSYKSLVGINSSNNVVVGQGAPLGVYIGDSGTQVNPVYIRVNSSSKNITQGAWDSGGSGKRVLCVPN